MKLRKKKMRKIQKKIDIEGDERIENGEKKTKSELAREKKKEVVPNLGKEAPYPLVPSKKDKERHVAVSLIFSRNWRSLFLLEKPCNRCHSTPNFSKIY